jgi:parallel beta-helix repeat protein
VAKLPYIAYTERMVGSGHPALPDTLNRGLRALLSQSGYDPDASPFPGLMGPVFNVKAFDAKGDGATDDTAASHAARDAGGVGATLVFPAGTYLVSGLIASLADQTWILQRGATIKLTANAASNIGVITVTASGVQVVGPGTIDGNRANQSGSGIDGVRFATVAGADPSGAAITDGVVRDCLIRDCVNAGVSMYVAQRMLMRNCRFLDTIMFAVRARRSCLNVLIDGCIATKTARGSGATAFQIDGLSDLTGATTCNRIRVVNCVASTWANAGVYLNGTIDGVVSGCEVHDIGDIGLDAEFCQNVTFTGCTAADCEVAGIAFFQSVSYSAIVGCTSRLNDNAANGHGILVAMSSTHCTVEGNACSDNQGEGIRIISSTNITVVGNTVRQPGATGNVSVGMLLQSVSYSTVVGNTVENAYGHGLQLNICTFCTLTANTSRNNGRGATPRAGILLSGSSTNNIVSKNVSVDSQGAPTQAFGIQINAAADTANLVADNDVSLGNTTGQIQDAGTATIKRGNRRSAAGGMQGRAVLVNGTVTVNTAEVLAGDNILLTRVVGTSTTRGIPTVGTIVAGTSFVIRAEDLAGALSADDDSTVFWEIVH